MRWLPGGSLRAVAAAPLQLVEVDVQLDEAVAQRQHHRREPGTIRCSVCHEHHPCRAWRLARAQVLIMVRRAFQAARSGEPL
ncbi:hypothetical protein [Dactylosporangium sp. NPDC006015]|uniref:hypothetical protein n=1 Tax=Dactylosporangium sp. NPDC006015 TaxID=3154576 RepID=UPI0033A38C1B